MTIGEVWWVKTTVVLWLSPGVLFLCTLLVYGNQTLSLGMGCNCLEIGIMEMNKVKGRSLMYIYVFKRGGLCFFILLSGKHSGLCFEIRHKCIQFSWFRSALRLKGVVGVVGHNMPAEKNQKTTPMLQRICHMLTVRSYYNQRSLY
jgi:hypothetical protein